MSEGVFKLHRRPSSYNVDDMERWLRAHPTAKLDFQFSAQGWSMDPSDTRRWRMAISDRKKSYGYITETIAEALAALCNEDKQ